MTADVPRRGEPRPTENTPARIEGGGPHRPIDRPPLAGHSAGMEPHNITGLGDWLANPQPVAGLADVVAGWRAQEVTLVLAPVARADAGFGAHLRRSFLGALGPGASAEARAGRPCPWDPPCALDVFLREQLRAGADGLPKPYVLFWSQSGPVMTVTLRVFGTACTWFMAAAEALTAGLTGILPWSKALPGQRTAPAILDRRFQMDAALPDLPQAPLILRLDSPMDDSGGNPTGPQDPAAQMLARAVRRVDALAHWQGLALTEAATRALTLAAHDIRASATTMTRHSHDSPNSKGQVRRSQVLTGEMLLPPLPDDLRLLLALATSCHLGRHTNEGLGAISLHLAPLSQRTT